MPKNPLQFIPIEREHSIFNLRVTKPTDEELERPQVQELDGGKRRVIYGRGITPRLEVAADADSRSLGGRTGHPGDVVKAVQLAKGSAGDTCFVLVGKSCAISGWSLKGERRWIKTAHKRRIGAIWELSGGVLVSWGEDKLLVFWNAQDGSERLRIKTTARTAGHVHIGADGTFIVLVERFWNARVVSSADGRVLTRRRLQRGPISDARRLRTGRWLMRSEAGVRLWEPKPHWFPRPLPAFSFEDGYLEPPDMGGLLLIIDDQQVLHVLNAAGAATGIRGPDATLGALVRDFIRGHQANATDLEPPGPTPWRFGARISPLSEPSADSEQALLGAQSALPAGVVNEVWHVFQRPHYAAIRAWLSDARRGAHKVCDHAQAAFATHDRRARSARRVGNCAVFGLGAALMWLGLSASFGRPPWQILAPLLIVVGCLYLLLTKNNEVLAMEAAKAALKALHTTAKGFIRRIRKGRRRLRDTLPCVSTGLQYDGSAARNHIQHTIFHTLKKQALEACNLLAAELVTIDREPLIFRDWSLLARGEASESLPNLKSFWWMPDGHFALAVERVQFLMPTRDSLWVYSVDYDFVRSKICDNAVYTLRYTDVATVKQRRLVRPVPLPDICAEVDALELMIESDGGEVISLVSLHETSAHKLRAVSRNKSESWLPELRRNLEDELNASPAGTRGPLLAMLIALDAESLVGDPPDPSRRLQDAMAQEVRRLVVSRKSSVATPVVESRPN